MELKPFLDYIRQYIELTAEEEAILLSKVKLRKYLKGQFVVQNGDVCKYENFVLSGCLKAFYIDNEGQEHVVMFAIENWWIADLGSFITQTPADLNVQCLENSELGQIHYKDLQQLYVEIPKLERFFRVIIQKAFVAAQKRIINNFALPAMDRYLQFREQYPKIEQRIPQYLIASYLGMTKEFLSKIRSQLISKQE
ncbi:MAG: Crp/Fnr family transcriptional regulator [Bacteroidetes bacterium]|nr:MAG: Crp/Fnr family transcriptional regulator [Bacteroidota bacterium]